MSGSPYIASDGRFWAAVRDALLDLDPLPQDGTSSAPEAAIWWDAWPTEGPEPVNRLLLREWRAMLAEGLGQDTSAHHGCDSKVIPPISEKRTLYEETLWRVRIRPARRYRLRTMREMNAQRSP